MPLYACEPGSFGPSYASTSVSRTATSPCRSVAPSRRGATSRTGPSSSAHPGTVLRDGGPQLGQLLDDPVGCGAAAAVARRDRTIDGEHVAHGRRQVRVEVGELFVRELVELDAELLAPAYG